jgi:predicted Zn-dependent peptidase
MHEEFFTHEMPNGLTLLGERMEQVSSVSMTLVAPIGAAFDPPGAEGAAAVASEWLFRGAGDRNTRGLNEALDVLGCQHGQAVQSAHVQFDAAQLGRNFHDVLALYADILRRPRLEDSTFEPSRDLAMQDLASLDDEPARMCTTMLRERFYPAPLGQCVFGRKETLASLQADAVRKHLQRLGPKGTILCVAGDIDWDVFRKQAENLFGDWKPQKLADPDIRAAEKGVLHVKKETAQVHIALAHPTVTYSHPQYYAARMAETILSGGMSSRLFTEVREKRGLVYHVSARYHSLKDHAGIFTYAGTTPEKAQQTFEVTVGEIRRLSQGVTEHEMASARTQLRSSLIMQGESTSSRSSSLASDWHHLRRLRSLQEISEAVEKISVADVMDHLRQHPAKDFTVLVVGPEPLDTGCLS